MECEISGPLLPKSWATQDEIYNQMAAQFNKTGVWSVRAFAEHGINEEDFSGVRLDKLLKGLNQRILKHLGAENLIGHHFFINIDSQQELSLLFGKKILPRLQILFYNEPHYLQAILKNEGEELPFLIPVEEGIPIVNAWSLQVNPKLLAGDFTQKDFEGLYWKASKRKNLGITCTSVGWKAKIAVGCSTKNKNSLLTKSR